MDLKNNEKKGLSSAMRRDIEGAQSLRHENIIFDHLPLAAGQTRSNVRRKGPLTKVDGALWIAKREVLAEGVPVGKQSFQLQ